MKSCLAALIALKQLLRERTIADSVQSYDRASRRLDAAIDAWQGSKRSRNPDFSLLTSEEKRLRNEELLNIWETTARFGNVEKKRVKSERDGLVGRLNLMLNISGAELRDLFLCMFPFPEPNAIGKAKHKILWGYIDPVIGSVEVAHGHDLPEMDFADMLRSHLRELCRKSFATTIPSSSFKRYNLLLIRQLIPFAEWVYTDGETGCSTLKRNRKGSEKAQPTGKGADSVLGNLVTEIESLYGESISGSPAPTRHGSEPSVTCDSKFFAEQANKLRNPEPAIPPEDTVLRRAWADYIESLLYSRPPRLRDADAVRLEKTAQVKARWEGIKIHSRFSSGMPQPFSLRSIFLKGDRFVKVGRGLLLTAENVVHTPLGRGRADLILFKRVQISNSLWPRGRIVFRPVAVFDVKTRTACEWEIKAKNAEKSESVGLGKVRPRLVLRRTGLNETEWVESLAQAPTARDLQQLSTYSSGILHEYLRVTGDESASDLLKGIVLIDTEQDVALARRGLLSIVNDLCGSAASAPDQLMSLRTVISYNVPALRHVAVILDDPSNAQLKLLALDEKPLERRQVYQPFPKKRHRQGRYILYMSVASASRSGPSAAWIAQYYHGVQYIHGLSKQDNANKVLWVDLAGCFGFRELAEQRLRIESQPEEIQRFFHSVEILDLSSSVDSYLFEGKPVGSITYALSQQVNSKKPQIVIVDGWQLIEDSAPPRLRAALVELERELIGEVGSLDCTIVWFGRPIVDECTSTKYQRRSVLPFESWSPHKSHVTDLVWNLPVRPSGEGRTAPMLDDLRVVIEHNAAHVNTPLFEVPLLRNWSARFWSKRLARRTTSEVTRRRQPLIAHEVVDSTAMASLRRELIYDSLELLPWLRDLWPNEFGEQAPTELVDSVPVVTLVTEKAGRPLGVMSRMTYRPKVADVIRRQHPVSISETLPTRAITHSGKYRERKLRSKPIKQSYKPPGPDALVAGAFSATRADNVEIRRLKKTLRYISAVGTGGSAKAGTRELRELGRDLLAILESGNRPPEKLKQIARCLETSETSSWLWRSLGRVREYQLGTGLRFSAGAYLSNLLDVRPYIPFRYGNYLLLVILAFRVRHPNLQQGDIETLWRTMKPWLLMQLGLTMDKGLRVAQENKWDVRAVWASLSKRVTFLSGMRTPNLTRVRYGQILSANDEENAPYFGVFIEDQFNEYSLLAGVWRGLNPLLPSGSVRWTLTDYSQMSSAVSLCRTPDEKHDLVLCNVSGSDYVWWREEGEWILLGRISLVPRNKHALFRIRGIEIIGIESDKAPGIPGYLSMPSDLQQRIGSDINSALNEMVSVVPVKCEIDIKEGVYTFELRAENSVCESRRLSDTRQLLRLLRLPLVEGIPLQSTKNPGQFFTWDPYSDIEYNGLELLKPYVERRTPYLNVDLPLPATCRELISKPEMKQEMVIVHDASLCPIAQKTGMDHALCWRIEFPGGCTDSKLVEMSAKGLTDVEIANLLSTKELYTEQGHYTFEIGFSDDPDTRAGTVFRESRAIARTLDMKLTKPGLYLFLDDEKLSCSLVRDGHGIEMHARSSLSDEHVWSGGIVTLKEGWTIKSATKEAETAISEIAEGYFEEETSKERIDDYPGLRRNLARVLSEIQLEDMTKLGTSQAELEKKVKLVRDLIKQDPILELDLARTLYELAWIAKRKKDLAETRDYIEECIHAYQHYMDSCNDDSPRREMERAKALSRRIAKEE